MMLNYKNILLLSLIFLFVQMGYGQFTIPEKPKKQSSVYDYADLLSAGNEKNLEQKLLNYADTTSTQIVIAIIENLEGENIGLLTPKWAQEWGVGQAEEDNGVFIVLAEQERKIWISPGYGAEEKLTAGIVGEITRNVIIPEFKSGDYYKGLDKGTSAIMQALAGMYENNAEGDGGKRPAGILFVFVIVFVVIIIILSRIKNNRGGGGGRRFRRGMDFTDILILSSLGRGGFGSDSGSSGGFGSGGFGGGFGGGGFSGGGAGGSW